MATNLIEGSITFLDAVGGELINALFEKRTSDPGSPQQGRFWVRTDLTPKEIRWYDGSTVKTVAALTTEDIQDIVGGLIADTSTIDATYNDAGNLESFAVLDSPTLQGHDSAYHLARGNHSGTQAAATISDLAATVQAYRLDQFAAPTGAVSMGTQRLTNVSDPSSAQDAATKAYVDAAAAGIDWKASVRAASTGNLTLSGTQTIDGVSVVAGERVLAKDQTTGANNGIYTVAAGAWTRATDMDSSAESTSGVAVFVEEGTVNGDTGWVLTTNNPITLGTTALVFTQFTSLGQVTAGNGLTKTGSTIAVQPGNGVLADGSSTRVDPAVVVRKYSANIGDGATTAIAVTHSLGTKDVHVVVRRNSDDAVVGLIQWVATSTTVVTITFDTAPASAAYRVTVFA